MAFITRDLEILQEAGVASKTGKPAPPYLSPYIPLGYRKCLVVIVTNKPELEC